MQKFCTDECDLIIAQMEQCRKDAKHRLKWEKICLCTDLFDKPVAESAINSLYRLVGLRHPKIVWCGSPLSQILTKTLVLNFNDKVFKRKSNQCPVDIIRNLTNSSIEDDLSEEFWSNLRLSYKASLGKKAGENIRLNIDKLELLARDKVGNKVGESIYHGAVVSFIHASEVIQGIEDNINESLRRFPWDNLKDGLKKSTFGYSGWFYGQCDIDHAMLYDYFLDDLGLTEEVKVLEPLFVLVKSVGGILARQKICWVSDRYQAHQLVDGRLHSLTGPALVYRDGWEIYALYGFRVPSYIVKAPQQITMKKIGKETDPILKQIMILHYPGGRDKYFLKSGAKIICKTERGELYKKMFKNKESSPMVMMKRLDANTNKTQFFRVPPETQSVNQAIEWLDQKSGKEYDPFDFFKIGVYG